MTDKLKATDHAPMSPLPTQFEQSGPMQILPTETSVPHPLAIIQAYVARGGDPAQMDRLLDLQERYERNEGAKAFGTALAAFQAECPPIEKKRSIKKKDSQDVRYKFGDYSDIMEIAGPIMAKHGISVSMSAPTTDKRFDMVMRVQVGSYFVDKPYSAPMPDMQKLATALFLVEPQAFNVALAYHRKNCLVIGMNIVLADENTGDAAPQINFVTADQLEQIRRLLDECAGMVSAANHAGYFEKYLKWLKVAKIEEIPQAAFVMAVDELNQRIAKGKACAK